MGKTLKIDITEKIVAKFKKEYLELYSHKFRIGKLYIHGEKCDLVEGYLYENGRFYRLIHTRRDVNPL